MCCIFKGLILIVTKNEEWTFWLLKILIEEVVQNYHTKTMRGLITDIGVLRELLNTRAPDICQHLDNVGMPFPVVTTKWFICMFAEVFPVETVLRIWDCIFFEGSKVRIMNIGDNFNKKKPNINVPSRFFFVHV